MYNTLIYSKKIEISFTLIYKTKIKNQTLNQFKKNNIVLNILNECFIFFF